MIPESAIASHYVGTRKASRLLGVSELTVRLWADTGRLETIRDHAGRRMITRESVEAVRRARAATRGPEKPRISPPLPGGSSR